MSIAVSAIVTPSRCVRAALSGYALANAGAAVGLAFGAPGRFHFAWLLAAACLLAALTAARAALRAGTTRRLDISGRGELSLTVQQSMDDTAPHQLVLLLPGSTVWPNLLLLVLRNAESGVVTVLAILPDSVSHEHFRKLAVAIRAIARRDNKFSEKNKIH